MPAPKGWFKKFSKKDKVKIVFADIDDKGIIDPTQELTNKRYKWLEDNFKKGSDAIKNMKGTINNSAAHSNIVYAHHNFRFDGQQGRFITPYFDGVNKGLSVIKFVDDFLPKFKALETENHRLKAEIMSTERFKEAQKLASK